MLSVFLAKNDAHKLRRSNSRFMQVFQGNTDKDTVVSHVFPQHIRARYIRIWPKTWTNHVAMRVELYGCYIE